MLPKMSFSWFRTPKIGFEIFLGSLFLNANLQWHLGFVNDREFCLGFVSFGSVHTR